MFGFHSKKCLMREGISIILKTYEPMCYCELKNAIKLKLGKDYCTCEKKVKGMNEIAILNLILKKNFFGDLKRRDKK